ncbi:hypothetical protein KGF54_004377 [Candida jiufengensis]|uniref:uncharacterized protein n=1 Tax=Candida jiufengensis TaxID=497108 RepID=UPI002225B645|nr:uncharacterized protein KGF54_004377 [Candida jiufengensis]KAI5951303.1 hypothetical protein KGF54_004377 [Candida jiufengensis]
MSKSPVKKDDPTSSNNPGWLYKIKSIIFLNNKIIDFDKVQSDNKTKDDQLKEIQDFKIPTLPLPNNYQKRLPKLNYNLKTRLNFLSMEIYNSSKTTQSFLHQNEDIVTLEFIAFTNKFKLKLYKSLNRLINEIIEISKIWYNSPMFGFEIIKLILQESSNFIVGCPYDPILVECFCFTLYCDYEILNLVVKLKDQLKRSKFKKFKNDICLNMLIVFNLNIKNGDEFANDFISKFITLWVYALLDVN